MSPSWYVRAIGLGDQGDDVRAVQQILRTEPSGVYDETLCQRVRGYRRLCGLPHGSGVDLALANRLGELR